MPLTMQATALAAVVKDATQQNHTEVENLLLPRLASIRTVADYAAILKMFYGYFFPVETAIHRMLSAVQLPDISGRRNAAFALADLRALGQQVDGIELCKQLPPIESPAQAFGALYVLEGSTLGGKMIAKMLLKNEAVQINEAALHFFSGYKEETGSRWKTFLAALNNQTETGIIVASANATFAHLKSWMQHSFNYEEHSKL